MSTREAAVRTAVLALLERAHGMGPRDGRAASWVDARVARAIEELARARGIAVEGVPNLLAADAAALSAVADALRVGETSFYRDPAQWDAVRAWARKGHGGARASRWRALSVGCSTGEEAVTLALVFDELDCAAGGGAFSVVGIDRSVEALDVARRGEYPAESLRCMPAELVARGFETDDCVARVREGIRRRTSFVERDATRGLPAGEFELVLCKNVLIYFGDASGERLVRQLVRALAPGGLLLVARSEVARLRGLGVRAVELAPGITAFCP